MICMFNNGLNFQQFEKVILNYLLNWMGQTVCCHGEFPYWDERVCLIKLYASV